MTRIGIAITGLGGVGSLLAETILARRDEYRRRFGVDLTITGVCGRDSGFIAEDGITAEHIRDRRRLSPGLTGERFIASMPAQVLFEATPSDYTTGGAAATYIPGALSRGIDVVAISKGALVVGGGALRSLAAEHSSQLRVSAAAGAGLPMVDFLSYALAGMHIESVDAILTGTTAFVLDAMTRMDLELDEALALAQERGIAEPDPAFDLDGWDTAAKIVILVGEVFGAHLDIGSLPREGIRAVTRAQLRSLRERDLGVALVGRITNDGKAVAADVSVRTFPSEHPFGRLGAAKGLVVGTRESGSYVLTGGASSREATVAAAMKDLEHILSSGARRRA